jgi:hypothetical protein
LVFKLNNFTLILPVLRIVWALNKPADGRGASTRSLRDSDTWCVFKCNLQLGQ